MPIVYQVCAAMQKFKSDFVLQRHACVFIGRLCVSSGAYCETSLSCVLDTYLNVRTACVELIAVEWRKRILTTKEPDILSLLQDISKRFEAIDQETHTSAKWASARMQGKPVRVRRIFSPNEAAKCIQGMYRTRKARQHVRSLAQAIYHRAVDPATGLPYFYNSRTGATSWSMPAFLS